MTLTLDQDDPAKWAEPDHRPVTETEKLMIAGYNIKPHPDGLPWAKCCGTKKNNNCQCFMRKPKCSKNRYEEYKVFPTTVRLIKEDGRFFCVHRKTPDEFHRVCAGWAASFSGKRKP